MNAKDRAAWMKGLRKTTDRRGWRCEWRVAMRHRRALIMLLSALIVGATFLPASNWFTAACFGALAVYSALYGVRLGVLAAGLFAVRTALVAAHVNERHSSRDQLIVIALIGALGMLIIWRSDDELGGERGGD